ncbi:hypothetical protein Scep_004612 [Stephania cephalantha]|uniref:Uncharacterized protein n=1 Tax=Stephania cephalantha TaxID=152367 RepID=A0AAP0KSS2_9MAGN
MSLHLSLIYTQTRSSLYYCQSKESTETSEKKFEYQAEVFESCSFFPILTKNLTSSKKTRRCQAL